MTNVLDTYRTGRSLLVVLMASGVTACDGDDPSSANLEPCDGPVEISVSSGTEPRFTWSPACTLFFLNVEPAESGGDIWGVISDGENVIAPGVRYGVVPEGAEQFTDESVPELVEDSTYKVVVAYHTGPGEQDGELAGIEEFTP